MLAADCACRGGALHLPQKSAVLIKQEDGTSQAATRQQQQQQRGLAAAAQHADVQQQVRKTLQCTVHMAAAAYLLL
jgi:hypothetical protein